MKKALLAATLLAGFAGRHARAAEPANTEVDRIYRCFVRSEQFKNPGGVEPSPTVSRPFHLAAPFPPR